MRVLASILNPVTSSLWILVFRPNSPSVGVVYPFNTSATMASCTQVTVSHPNVSSIGALCPSNTSFTRALRTLKRLMDYLMPLDLPSKTINSMNPSWDSCLFFVKDLRVSVIIDCSIHIQRLGPLQFPLTEWLPI